MTRDGRSGPPLGDRRIILPNADLGPAADLLGHEYETRSSDD